MFYQCSACPHEQEAASISSLKARHWFVRYEPHNDDTYILCPDCVRGPLDELNFRSEIRRFKAMQRQRTEDS